MKARLIILLCLVSALSACVTSSPAKYGVQANHLAHIPARIAVLPCALWPQGALYAGQSKTEMPATEITEFCSKFDKFVLAGFEGQPYVRGLAPAVVKQLLKRQSNLAQLEQLEPLWFRPTLACASCKDPLAYYKDVLAGREDWRQWLSGISRETTSSDAVLIPFLAEARGEVIDDRGLYFAQRTAKIVLLLIDSNNGELIWIGTKQGELRLPLDKKPADPKSVALPSWDELNARIFVPELWAEFPGRQG